MTSYAIKNGKKWYYLGIYPKWQTQIIPYFDRNNLHYKVEEPMIMVRISKKRNSLESESQSLTPLCPINL